MAIKLKPNLDPRDYFHTPPPTKEPVRIEKPPHTNGEVTMQEVADYMAVWQRQIEVIAFDDESITLMIVPDSVYSWRELVRKVISGER